MTGVPVPPAAIHRGAPATPARRGAAKSSYSLLLLHLYFVWAMTLLDLQYFLSATVSPALLRVVHLAYPPLLISMAFQAPVLLTQGKPWMWYPPFLIFFLTGAITAPFAENLVYSRLVFIYLLLYYTMALATAVYVKTVKQAMPIILMMALQFLWFAIFARERGIVMWHPTLSNHDGFGSFSVIGVGMCYWFGASAKDKRLKWLFYGLALYSVIGVVASYARAAFLSLVALAGWIWVRSPNKGATAAAGVAATIAVLIGASLFFDAGFFWAEMKSSFTEGTTEGTGGERWKLWMAAIEVWKVRPIFGAGGGNFGAFAATYFRPGELPQYENPLVLYGFNLHNSYFQILSEFGTVGVIAVAWLLIDFFKKNNYLRGASARQKWAIETGGKFDLYYIALALESANLAAMLGGLFYASLFMPWFWTIWIANRLLWQVTKDAAPAPVAAPAGRRGGRFNPVRRR